jgi:hypothetical protein
MEVWLEAGTDGRNSVENLDLDAARDFEEYLDFSITSVILIDLLLSQLHLATLTLKTLDRMVETIRILQKLCSYSLRSIKLSKKDTSNYLHPLWIGNPTADTTTIKVVRGRASA